MKVYTEVYNYTTNESFSVHFPLTQEEVESLMSKGEVMVDYSPILPVSGEVGYDIKTYNQMVEKINEAGLDKSSLKILSQTYLTNEIMEMIDDDRIPTIINFDEETSHWSSSDFYSESDKGRLLYELGYTIFPVKVPEELVDYVDYEKAYRDAEINMSIRSVVFSNVHYLIIP